MTAKGPDQRLAGLQSAPARSALHALDDLDQTLLLVQRGDAAALDRARNLSTQIRSDVVALNRNRAELASLYTVGRKLASVWDLEQLLGLILDEAIPLVNAERGLLVLYTGGDDDFEVKVTRHVDRVTPADPAQLEISQRLIRHILSTRQPLITTDAQHDRRFAGSSSVFAYQIHSVLAVPLLYGAELIGAIYVDTRLNIRTFQDTDLNLLSAMANQAAVAIHLANLYENLKVQAFELASMLRQLGEAQDEMVRTERLSAIGRFASTIIHDLKGPLTVINGLSQLLAQPDLTDEQRAHFGRMITDAVDSFVTMTQEILDYAQGEHSLCLELVSVIDFLQEVSRVISREFEPFHINATLVVEYTGTIRADRRKLWRVFYNIARNAAEAMTSDPAAAGQTRGRSFSLTVRRSGHWVEFLLSDTGPGIAPEVRERLFEPFATSGKIQGTGLGLAIAHSIVEAHKGHISVQSELGQGSTFTIQLPLPAEVSAG